MIETYINACMASAHIASLSCVRLFFVIAVFMNRFVPSCSVVLICIMFFKHMDIVFGVEHAEGFFYFILFYLQKV